MSRSHRPKAPVPQPENAQGKNSLQAVLCRIFKSRQGSLRAIWLICAVAAAYALWNYGMRALLGLGFSALFSAWGVTDANLSLAPGWAQLIVRNYGIIVSLVVNGGLIAIFLALARLFSGSREKRPSIRGMARMTGIGAAGAALGTALFLLLDSLRCELPLTEPQLHPMAAVLAVLYLLAAFAEESCLRGCLYRCLSERSGRAAAMLASAIAAYVLGAGWNLNGIGMLNLVLQSLLCCLLYAHGGLGASVGFRFGWTLIAGVLFSYPGGSTDSALWTLYHVSDAALTGGNRGLLCGLWMTALLLGVGAFVLLRAKGIETGKKNERKVRRLWTKEPDCGKLK